MKNSIKKSISILTVMIMLFNALPFFVVAESVSPVSVEIFVAERNGTKVSGYPVRRGIPFAEGEIMPDTDLIVKDGNNILPSDTQVIETYPDGSVKWLLVSFSVDLEENEKKTLYLTNGSYKGNLSYNETTGELSNGKISMTITDSGVKNLKGENDAAEKIEFYVRENDETYILKNAETSILAKTESYIKVRISGTFTKGIEGVMEITLPDNSERVQIDYRINTKRNVKIVSTGLLINGQHTNAVGSRTTDNIFSFSGMDVVSYDNQRFKGAIKNSLTGFTAETENTVRLAPLLHFKNKNDSYMFYDGVSRTFHAYFCPGGEKGHANAVANPPSVGISPAIYKDAGILYTDTLTAPAKEMIDSIKSIKGKLDGRFEAGSIPLGFNNNLEVSDGFNARPGEGEYNISYGYMMSGEEDLYDILMYSAENWADVVIYTGQYGQLRGANRSHTGTDLEQGASNAFSSHPYYGESGGLYMAYVLSGNEYFKEVFLECCDHVVKSMYLKDSNGNYLAKNFGNFMMYKWFWREDGGNKIGRSDFAESRYLIVARPLYLAYGLTGKEDYHRAAMDVAQWAHDKQQPNGSWPQAYFHYKVEKILDENGNETYDENGKVRYKKIYYDENKTYEDKYGAILIQGAQQSEHDIYEGYAPFKLYIMLYGYRGVSDMMHWEENEMMRETLIKFADYLCDQNETFGPGLYHPNGDRELYPENEDNTFGRGPATDLMALEVIAKAYEVGGDIRHLKNMCTLLESYLCFAYGGLVPDTISEAGKKSISLSPVISRSSTYLKSASYISYLMNKNRELISELGYDNLLIAFSEDAKTVTLANCIEAEKPIVTHNEYELNGEKALFAAASTPLNLNNDGEVTLEMTEDNLWQGDGVINFTEKAGKLFLKKPMKQYQMMTAIQRPVKMIPEKGSSISAKITEYNENSVKIELDGAGSGEIVISDGEFPVHNGKKYSVIQEPTEDGEVRLTVTEGEGEVLSGNELRVEVTLGNGYIYDNFNRSSNFDRYTLYEGASVKDLYSAKERSLNLASGASVAYDLLSGGNVSVISQDFCSDNNVGSNFKMSIGDISILYGEGELFVNEQKVSCDTDWYKDWFKLTAVLDNSKNTCEIYINGDKVKECKFSQLPSRVTYISEMGKLLIDNLVLADYGSKENAEEFLNTTLHRNLTTSEENLLTRVNALKETEGESSAFYKKLQETEYFLKNTLVGEKEKEKHTELVETLEECAENSERWLVMAENFEGDMNTVASVNSYLNGGKILSTKDAVLNGDDGILRLQKVTGEDSSRIVMQSWEVGDEIEVNFKYMQPWRSYNPYVYYCGDTDQKDYAVRIGATDGMFYYYNGSNGGNKLIDYEAGRWYEFSVHIHLSSRTYDIYIDGELKAENIKFSSVKNNFDRPDLGRFFNAKPGTDRASYLYDDIYVYGKKPAEDRITLLKMNNSLGDYLMASSNVTPEKTEGENVPAIVLGIFNGNKLVSVEIVKTDENNILKARLYASALKNGTYTAKVYLMSDDGKLSPESDLKEQNFEVSGKTITFK